ncbi:MAG: DUF4185 domain-containing protein [Acidobacteria bacterium]|nr:DUF4185 domain-containing protein [Acidobacteriota bacterium]
MHDLLLAHRIRCLTKVGMMLLILFAIELIPPAHLFVHPCIGEFSVASNPFLRKWLMLYNCDSPRGINFRVADQPWGRWSPPAVLFDPWADGGYCHFMHVSWDFRNCDSVYDSMFGSPRQREWAGEYGPYQIPRYTTGDATSTTIYYTMSTWNPYQVVLMKSTLRLEPTGQAMTATGGLSFFQSRYGRQGNFEVVVLLAGGGLAHYWRDNDSPGLPWHGPIVFGTSGSPSMRLRLCLSRLKWSNLSLRAPPAKVGTAQSTKATVSRPVQDWPHIRRHSRQRRR